MPRDKNSAGNDPVSWAVRNPSHATARQGAEVLLPFDQSQGAPQRIAVIGGGIAGMASAWLLS
ncbi:MAG TPA: hypothetical protein PLH11_09575, partial [Gemmobacter sp.]|nr:hypothetical protein [Gemmobacter sp.]